MTELMSGAHASFGDRDQRTASTSRLRIGPYRSVSRQQSSTDGKRVYQELFPDEIIRGAELAHDGIGKTRQSGS
ncbi:IS1 family transposase [Tunturiibacter psychrotolerans]